IRAARCSRGSMQSCWRMERASGKSAGEQASEFSRASRLSTLPKPLPEPRACPNHSANACFSAARVSSLVKLRPWRSQFKGTFLSSPQGDIFKEFQHPESCPISLRWVPVNHFMSRFLLVISLFGEYSSPEKGLPYLRRS